MKKRTHFYSAPEILSIIDRAQAAGIKQIIIPGFEAIWEIPKLQPPAPTTPAPEVVAPAAPATPLKVQITEGVQPVPPKRCLACNEALKKNSAVGNLCVRCYRARHEPLPTRPQEGYLPWCDTHNVEFVPSKRAGGRPYCRECWLEDKESKNEWRWRR